MFQVISIFLAVFVVVHARPSFTDEVCVSWDDKVEQSLFVPLRNEMGNTNTDVIFQRNIDYTVFGFGLKVDGGSIGNFSNFELSSVEDRQHASNLCVLGDRRDLSVYVTFSSLVENIKYFSVDLPYFPTIGGTGVSLNLQGIKVLFDVTLVSDGKSCSAQLKELDIYDLGDLSVHFEDGAFNWVLDLIFNWASRLVIIFLRALSLDYILSTNVFKLLSPIIASNQDLLCQLIK